MLMHLVKIPLMLRAALASDATSLMQLQAASGCAPQASSPWLVSMVSGYLPGGLPWRFVSVPLHAFAIHSRYWLFCCCKAKWRKNRSSHAEQGQSVSGSRRSWRRRRWWPA